MELCHTSTTGDHLFARIYQDPFKLVLLVVVILKDQRLWTTQGEVITRFLELCLDSLIVVPYDLPSDCVTILADSLSHPPSTDYLSEQIVISIVRLFLNRLRIRPNYYRKVFDVLESQGSNLERRRILLELLQGGKSGVTKGPK